MNASIRWIVLLCCAALVAPLAAPLVTGRVFVFGDLQAFNLPYRYLYQQALRGGDSLLWTPSIFSGVYMHGEGQGGVFHPLHLLTYFVFPLQAAFNLEILANYVLALPGMYVFLRRLRVDPQASWFGAMLFAFGGFNLLHHDHVNLVAVIMHVPWLLAAIDITIAAEARTTLALGYAGVTLLVASELLLGFPQGVWLSLLAAGIFALVRAIAQRRLRRLLLLASALATSALIGGIQLLPTSDVSRASIRPLLPRDFALSFSLHPYNLLQFWSPYVFSERVYSVLEPLFLHEFGIYSGAILIVSLPWLWIRRRDLRPWRGAILASIAFAALTLVLALGRYGGLDVALTRLPVLESIRAPVRYIALTNLALMVLAAIAFHDLLALQRAGERVPLRTLWPLAIPLTASVVTTLALNARLSSWMLGVPFSTVARAAVGSAILFVVTAAVAASARGVRWAPALLVIVTAADVGLWGVREVWRQPPQTIASLVADAEPPSYDGEYVFKSTFAYPGNVLVLRGYRLSSGYVALPPATYFNFASIISLQLSGTHWDYTDRGRRPIEGGVDRARLIADARFTPKRFGYDFNLVDLHKTALVDVQLPPLSGAPGTARVLVDRPGRILVEATTPGTQLLALTERFDPGWRATENGRPLQTVAIHGDFLGCLLEPGTHRVEFHFMPVSFVRGAWISVAGIVLLVGAVVWIARQ